MTSQRCKGARDLLPGDTERFRYIEDKFRSLCLSWGYQEVRTPTLEYLHLFTAAGTLTPNMLGKVYSFLDWDGWSGERVVLRPDGTIPVARLYVENLAQKELARFFYVTNVFVFEETGKENRERWQCGIELLGNAETTSDIEIITLAVEILHSLGISGIEIKLSHAGMLNALIKELKLNPDEETKLLTQLLDGNWQVLKKTKAVNSDVKRLLSLLLDLRGKSSGFLENIKALPQIPKALRSELGNFAEVTGLLDSLDCNYQVDITSTRGFEYYTGLCFQLSYQGTRIGSGGRYDNLVPLIGGKNTPACGFALYIDPLMNLVQPMTEQKTKQKISVRGMTTTPEVTTTCFQLARTLHEANYVAELDFSGCQSNCRWVITVPEKPSSFMVTDQIRNKKVRAASASEIIDIIGATA